MDNQDKPKPEVEVPLKEPPAGPEFEPSIPPLDPVEPVTPDTPQELPREPEPEKGAHNSPSP